MTRRRTSRVSKSLEAEARIRGWRSTGTPRELSRIQDLILNATGYATAGLRDLAHDANISESTLSSWRRGTRTPPPDAIEALAAALRDRAQLLAWYAERLLSAASEDSG
jgi:transcriptional regulator with XRE-family HTH domain